MENKCVTPARCPVAPQGGFIFIALTGQDVSHAMQKMQSFSLTGSALSVLYFSVQVRR
jgi:hypothetical protein